MRKIEFKPSVNTGLVRVFVDGVQLEASYDLNAIKTYRQNKSKLPPIIGTQIVETFEKKVKNDVVNLTTAEVTFITQHLKEELGL